MQSLVRS